MSIERSLAAEAMGALRRHVIEPVLSRCVDTEYGGFLVDFDARWQPIGPHDKTLEHVTRMTTSFALLDQRFPGEGLDVLARRGCQYLQEVMWDQEHCGFFASVDRAGVPSAAGLKHPHANTYAVRCFLLNAAIFDDGSMEPWIERSLRWLEDVAWDPVEGGYWGTFTRENQRYESGSLLPTPDGRDVFGVAPGFKEINTQGDAIEMHASLLDAGSPLGSRDRLAELARLVNNRLVHDNGILPYLFSPLWQPAADLARVGYQFIMARHLLLSSEYVGADELVPTACRMVDAAMSRGAHPHGGLALAVAEDGRRWPNSGGPADDRQWWVQIEAVHTLHLLAGHPEVSEDERARYAAWRDRLWQFLSDEYFDETFGGIRELPLPPDPSWSRYARNRLRRRDPLTGQRKMHGWKDPLHEVVTFLALSEQPVVAPN